MTSPLANLSGPNGPLRGEAPDADEFAGLVHSAAARLVDAQNSANSIESRFDLAYNAAHAYCLAALRHAGYRSQNRYVVFQCVPHTLGLGPKVWRVLAKCHETRNQSEYEGHLTVDDQLVTDLIVACKAVADAVARLPRIGT